LFLLAAQLEYYGMPAGTMIWVEGLGDGTYLEFKRNFFGSNEHTIDFTGPVPGVQTVMLRDLHWRVPGGVPGTKQNFASRRPSQEFRPDGSAPPGVGGAAAAAADDSLPQIAGPGDPQQDEMAAAAARFAEKRAQGVPRDGGGGAAGDAVPPPPVGRRGSASVERTQEEEEMDELAEMMRMRKPKNFGDGLLSGLGTIGTGVGAGVAAAVALPAAGAAQGGAKGFFKGLGAGIAAAVAAPVAGVVAGGVQISRGVAAASEAREAEAKGLIWDEKTESWIERVPWLLENEASKVAAMEEGGSKSGGGGARDVKETEFYDLLRGRCHDQEGLLQEGAAHAPGQESGRPRRQRQVSAARSGLSDAVRPSAARQVRQRRRGGDGGAGLYGQRSALRNDLRLRKV
jgi:hypothetical protein